MKQIKDFAFDRLIDRALRIKTPAELKTFIHQAGFQDSIELEFKSFDEIHREVIRTIKRSDSDDAMNMELFFTDGDELQQLYSVQQSRDIRKAQMYEKLGAANRMIKEAEEISEELGIPFTFGGPEYGMGGTYYPTTAADKYHGDGWVPSAHSC